VIFRVPLEDIIDTPRSAHDSDEEDETGLDEEEKMTRRRKRAMAISAEPIDPKTLKERMKLVPVVDKAPETEEMLLSVMLISYYYLAIIHVLTILYRCGQIIVKSPVLRNLDADQKTSILKALEGPITKTVSSCDKCIAIIAGRRTFVCMW
jgi:hypothetical protein